MTSRLLAVLLVLVLAACGGTKAKTDEDPRLNDPPANDKVAMPKGGPLVSDADEPAAAAQEEAPAEDSDATVVARADVDQFVARGPSFLLTAVTVEPVHREKQFQGYQITDVTRGAREFMTPQLRVGDIVTHANGIRLLRPEDYMEAWRSLDKAGTIRVDFIRQNEPMTATWTVR